MLFHYSLFDQIWHINESRRCKIFFHIFASIIKMFEFPYKIIIKQAVNMNYTELNIDKLTVATEMLKAIAHPMRIAIVGYLDGGVHLSVTEIHERLGIEQSTTSHHLGILKDKGVLNSKRDGKNTYYFLKHSALTGILDCIEKCKCED